MDKFTQKIDCIIKLAIKKLF